MYNLSNVFAKGRANTAGCAKLAVFFLVCLFTFCGCPANASDSQNMRVPFAKDGKLYSFAVDELIPFEVKAFGFAGIPDGFVQKAVCASKKEGYILAWNQKSKYLYHIDSAGYVSARVKLSGSIAYANKKYILMQTNSFSENKGFSFSLYSIKYTRANKKISLKKVWDGAIDCFVSDCFFTTDGVCISGGTKDDTKHNVFYITSKGIHKCFTTAKNSDFLRLLNTGSNVYAFISGREKAAAEPVVYHFTLDDYAEGSSAQNCINLKSDSKLPSGFECFFGFGFTCNEQSVDEAAAETSNILVLPASVDGVISFITYDCTKKQITSVVNDATGCFAPLANTSNGFYYIARDPLLADSWYGISVFNGSACAKVKEL